MGKKRAFQSTYLFPDELIGPDKRFFYFTSLLSYQYMNNATKVLNDGYSKFKIEQQSDLDWQKSVEEMIKLLNDTAKQEATNEQRLFKEVIEPLIKLDPEKFERFKDIFPEEGKINYELYLTLINILDKTVIEAKDIFSDLEAVTKDFNQSLQNVIKDATKLDEVINNDQGYIEFIKKRNDFVEKARKEMKGNRYTKIAEEMIRTYSDIKEIERAPDFVEEAFHGNTTIYQLKTLITRAVESMINGDNITKLTESYDRIKQLENKGSYLYLLQRLRGYLGELKTISDDYYRNIGKALDYLGGEEKDSSQISPETLRIAKLLQQDIITLEKNMHLAEEQYEKMQKIMSKRSLGRHAQSNEIITGLTKNRRWNIINSLREASSRETLISFEERGIFNKNTGQYEKLDIRKKSHNQIYMRELAKILHHHEKSQPLFKDIEERIQMTDTAARKQTLTVVSETSAAMFQAKILNALSKATTHNIGGSGAKTDITSSFRLEYSEIPDLNIDKAIDSIISIKTEEAEEIITNVVRDYNKEQNIYSKKRDTTYSVMGDTLGEMAIDKRITEELEERNIEMEKIAKYISEIFDINNSVKFGETYNEIERGFHGGSLGPTLEAQVDNITKMAEMGGITPPEAKFLISAIMNAGPGMLGNGQKNQLEGYLSGIAAMCMFNSGGMTLQTWIAQNVTPLQQKTQSNKIHIFTFDTVYVPLSYILTLISIGLQKCLTELQNFQSSALKGAQVVISNPINEKNDKISKIIRLDDKDIRIGDWYATANAGIPKVKLEMALLGGFLDVLETINSTLSKLF